VEKHGFSTEISTRCGKLKKAIPPDKYKLNEKERIIYQSGQSQKN